MKKIILLLSLLFTTSFLFSGEGIELDNINADWTRVLPGKPLSEPQTTSYGFVLINDAKSLMGFSSSGKLIFENLLTKTSGAFLGVLKNDFIAVITNSGKKLSLLNPDGSELWYVNNDFKITHVPTPGRDGRFFIRGNDCVACYGITGTAKWKLQTPNQSKLEMQELPDGSLILFLSKTVSGKSTAIRITPFGEIIEEITFAGEVLKALTTPKGVLLTFTDGTCGLFALENNVSTHKWLLKKNTNQKTNNDFFILSQEKDKILYINQLSKGIEIDFINLDDGSISNHFIIEDMETAEYGWYNDSGILLADSKNAYFYNLAGRYLWSGKIPSKNSKFSFTYKTFTNENCFVLFNNDWSIHAYKTADPVHLTKNNVKKQTIKQPEYNDFYKINTSFYEIEYPVPINKNLISDERTNILKKGNYSKTEQEFATELLSACVHYKNVLSSSDFGIHVEKSVFLTDSASMEKLLSQLSLYSCDTFTDYVAYFLKKETNKTLIYTLLKGISENGYDPEGKIMESLEYLARNTPEKDENILQAICDATYNICITMGYSAIEPKGKDILTSLLYPKFKTPTRDYARNTLKKLVGK